MTLLSEFAHVASLPHSHATRTVYLDNAAQTQMPQSVIQAVNDFHHQRSNVHRGDHFLANQATQRVEDARLAVADLINAPADCVIFTSGTTQSINMIAQGFPIGGVAVYTELEHHANIVPWQMHHKVRYVPMNDECQLEDFLSAVIHAPTGSIFALTHVSNVTGTKNPIKTLIAQAHEYGHYVLIDAAQSILTNPIDVIDLDVDFLAFSGHKMYGPTGVGVLYGKPHLLELVTPQMGGGDMIEAVYVTHHTLNRLPHRLEPGTPNVAGIIGLGEAARFVQRHRTEIIEMSYAITTYAHEKISELSDISVIGPARGAPRGALISFSGPIHPFDMSSVCDKHGVAVRGGSHCAHPLHRRLGIVGSTRASFSAYTTCADIDIWITAVKSAQEMFS